MGQAISVLSSDIYKYAPDPSAEVFAKYWNSGNTKRLGNDAQHPKKMLAQPHVPLDNRTKHLLSFPVKAYARFISSIGLDHKFLGDVLITLGADTAARLLFGAGVHFSDYLVQALWIFAYLKVPVAMQKPVLITWGVSQIFGILYTLAPSYSD